MMSPQTPVVKDLVLVGGGHAHVQVLKRLGMKPVAGLRITLVTRDIHTPYSGMLPGYVAGHYDYDDCHIDLGPLARFAGARLYHAPVEGLDLANQRVLAANRPPISYDLLSINTGSRPHSLDIPGVEQFALAAKPIDRFLSRWQQLVERVAASQGAFRVLVVGGGAGGVELALSIQYRLQQRLREAGDDPDRLRFELVTHSDGIMPTHNPGVRQRLQRIFAERRIALIPQRRVVAVEAERVWLDDGSQRPADAVIWVTTASAPDWLAEAGLTVDTRGFVRVNEQLQSISHPAVFAAGDIAALPDPRPKSGVFAVREGPILAHNLCAALRGKPLRAYRPQKHFLGLISTGNPYAIASQGPLSLESAALWTLKDWIDRRFMRRFNQLPTMASEATPSLASGLADRQAIKELSSLAMRCGGCGAKVGATVLERVMQRLPDEQRADVLIGRSGADDCALLAVPEGKLMVQSVDYFRAFIDDPYTFGAIAANHALGDLFAMGAEPQSVLAIATVPYGRERVVEETLYELLAGALETLKPTGAVLAGGHSSEGAELAFGLTVNGLVDPQRVWRKSGLQPGDALILTKPIGTGTLFAADMRGQAKGRWVDAALQSMRLSNQQAAECLQRFGATACTDLTGFGLAGHLLEMTRASGVDAALELDALPLLEGALDTVAAGILSSLQPQNLRLRRALQANDAQRHQHAFALLFDPQTAGGLLAGVPQAQASACLDALQRAGYPQAAIIGRIEPASAHSAPIHLL
ncbi:selenide, water dikinase SelD [Aestuariirhabdus litorea]|uniref:Selenide, water dikinase SelD n=1 Tax=Aestuariirhabdus litorea TaxID=2528527 RepID=A0A3P3VM93_9GAMM|nr:selenide, water dikinase SelD [Aestuariirhabdus litorea]RRJ82839.1 selenide, water dikinase SelD [Aestuariirhabdus litorea]RWW92998.1 selenide, water dikinase SelD [Endozoicomonadaceae bacterium GTF-13]